MENKKIGIVNINVNNLENIDYNLILDITRKNLLILNEKSGTSFGLCKIANWFSWTLKKPKNYKDDLKSILAIKEPIEKYTKSELIEILKFAKMKTQEYDELFKYRMGCNLIILDKDNSRCKNQWFCKRLSFEIGTFYYPSLSKVIEIFKNN